MKEIKSHEMIEETLITSRHNFSPSETFSSRNRLQVTDQGLPMETTRQLKLYQCLLVSIHRLIMSNF